MREFTKDKQWHTCNNVLPLCHHRYLSQGKEYEEIKPLNEKGGVEKLANKIPSYKRLINLKNRNFSSSSIRNKLDLDFMAYFNI